MPPNFKDQNEYFYHGGWTPEMDNLLLTSILREKQMHSFEGTVIPVEFLYEAEATIEEETGVRVNRDDVYNRLQFLEHRYRSFKGLVDHAGTRWDKPSNKVFASEKTWTAILKNSEFIGAYTVDGEPGFKQMQMLFSGDGLKQNKNQEVITISDTTVEDVEIDKTNRLGKVHVRGQSSSATLNPSNRFDEVGNISDRESSNGKQVASCASSSPNAWRHRPYE
ncbi:hypothetical protein AAHA92_21622 [Salvia divinorum]|uniref:Myb/SANT-like domain-containing protein n=1 Tax=Salvia divinorum TaxID=28513 RepID=A0ABD1GL13_SALDI